MRIIKRNGSLGAAILAAVRKSGRQIVIRKAA